MVEYEWDERRCRMYTEGLRPMVKHDHRPWAQRIRARTASEEPGLTVLDVATGPGFLLWELAALLQESELIAHDSSIPMLAVAKEEAVAAGQDARFLECPVLGVSFGCQALGTRNFLVRSACLIPNGLLLNWAFPGVRHHGLCFLLFVPSA